MRHNINHLSWIGNSTVCSWKWVVFGKLPQNDHLHLIPAPPNPGRLHAPVLIMLAVVINSELLDILFFDPAGVKNRLRRLVIVTPSPSFREREFHRNYRNSSYHTRAYLNQGGEVFIHAFGRATGGNCRLTRRVFDI